MSVLISPKSNHTRPIIVSRPEEKLDPEALGDQLAGLSRRRRITRRDEMVLEHLLAAGVLTLDQVRRLLWPEAAAKTAADRLSKLGQWHLLRRARQPWPERTLSGIAETPVFALGQGGWWWLAETEPEAYAYRLIDAEWVLRQLPAAEIYTRLAAAGASFEWLPRWRQPLEALQPANPAAVITLPPAEGQALTLLALELALINPFHAEARTQVYDDLVWTGPPLSVALVVRRRQQVAQTVADIQQRRRQPVTWLVTSWEQVLAAPSLLTASIWQRLAWQAAAWQVSLAEVRDG